MKTIAFMMAAAMISAPAFAQSFVQDAKPVASEKAVSAFGENQDLAPKAGMLVSYGCMECHAGTDDGAFARIREEYQAMRRDRAKQAVLDYVVDVLSANHVSDLKKLRVTEEEKMALAKEIVGAL